MKSILDIYLRRIPYNIRTIDTDILLPKSAAHFHNIPGLTRLYVCNRDVYYERLPGFVVEVRLYK